MPTLDAIIFITEPPEFEIVDGLVHIRQRVSERMCIERVMRLNTLLLTIQLAKEALERYERCGTAQVIPFPSKAENGHH